LAEPDLMSFVSRTSLLSLPVACGRQDPLGHYPILTAPFSASISRVAVYARGGPCLRRDHASAGPCPSSRGGAVVRRRQHPDYFRIRYTASNWRTPSEPVPGRGDPETAS